MKIVDYETFIRMPAGTIFAPFKPSVYEDHFEIKVDGGEEYADLNGNKRWLFNGTMPLEPWLDDNILGCGLGQYDVDFEIYDGDSNDASRYEMFAVLEPQDVRRLIQCLEWALAGCPGDSHEYYENYSYAACDRLNKDLVWVTPNVYERFENNPKCIKVHAVGKPLMTLKVTGKGC